MVDSVEAVDVLRPETPGKPAGKLKLSWRTLAIVCLGLLMFGLALTFIRHELKAYSLAKIVESLRTISYGSIGLAIAATLVSFTAISLYDYLALRYTEKKIPLRKTVFASFSAYAISNTIGMSALTGNAVRYRLYSSWGLNALDVAVIAFVTAFFLLISGLSLASFGLLTDKSLFESVFHLPAWVTPVLGIVTGAIVIGGLAFLLTGPETRTVKKITIKKPKAGMALIQWAVGIIDWIATAAVLYFLLPHGPEFSFLTFVPIFVAAHYIGAASGLPGGIGVFEAIFLLMVPAGDEVAVAAGLVAYRVVYYLLPLGISVVMLTVHQAMHSKDELKVGGERATDFLESIAPILYATLAFITGAVMLISAATPNLVEHMDFALRFVPNIALEASHLIASAVGTLLLLTALGLRRRLHNAWRLAVILFVLGAVFTFTKGGDLRGSILMLGLAGCLYISKDAFYRKGKLSQMRLSLPRLGALLGTVGLAIWSGLYAYRHKAYSEELWWNFGVNADASRFLRAAVIVGAILLIYFIWRLLAPAPAIYDPEDSETVLAQVKDIISKAEGATAEANLALIGDKQFIFSDSGQSFIMYGVKGRNWVAMGEPVGLESERKDLMWKFRQLADTWDAWPSFYSVRGEHLTDFVDLGLTVQKIGEMALVPIEGYTLEGSSRSKFRQARNKAIREGCSFEIINPAFGSEDMANLQSVSDDWMRDHQGKEKGFSLGRFDANVLADQPIAVVKKEGKIIAFANLWMTPDKNELSLDLMRYTDVKINGLMDYLFAEIMLWGSAQGYKYFSLGMAPLSGLEAHKLAPLMSKLGAMVFKYGGKIYGFEGLRSFKEKFDPEWEPVYLAAPSQMVMPQALGNLALLSSGGVLGLLQREG